jgi:hypothetical protein
MVWINLGPDAYRVYVGSHLEAHFHITTFTNAPDPYG